MSLKSQPSPPPAPDPTKVSAAQTGSNINTALAQTALNLVNSKTPYGSVSYNPTGSVNVAGYSVPQYTQTVTPSAAEAGILNSQQGLQQTALDTANQAIGNVQNTVGRPFDTNVGPNLQTSIPNSGNISTSIDYSKLPSTPLTANDFQAQGDQITNALMDRFNQDWAKQQENTVSRLNASGNQEGSAAYGTAMDTLNRARNDALNQAILSGFQEQNALSSQANANRGQMAQEAQAQANFGNVAQNQGFSQAAANAAFGNQARGQALSEEQIARSQPINEVASLLGLGPGVQMPAPAANAGTTVQPTNVIGAYGLQQQALQNAYNAQISQNNAMGGAKGNLLGTVGSAALGNWQNL